jgi:hypothetical protein
MALNVVKWTSTGENLNYIGNENECWGGQIKRDRGILKFLSEDPFWSLTNFWRGNSIPYKNKTQISPRHFPISILVPDST